ncbi:TadE-like protein [Rhodopirellula maiorica SM1]|uniref:TadE-like protein n=1 Tax=Rhodopirellula maiorica SM1 TaxID=1265738 RepID=M5RQJ4_9BACT|nr:TadE family protein [Rhodopirellula maiorica]EMI21481.1 TadE-like protein [Rhodopirellula maiorica SM1]
MTKRRQRRQRRGAALVEFAIVVPILFLFFFAAFEFCRAAMIRHTADNAVYEAARTGMLPGATADETEAKARGILNSLGLNNVRVQVTPNSIRRDTREVTVRVEVPMEGNSFVPVKYVQGEITRELTMRREGMK